MTEGIFAVLYVSIMGLTGFYKTTVFYIAVLLLNVKIDVHSIAQNQFQQRETKDRHIGIILLPF